MIHHMTYLEAGLVGLIQGVTELFPLSSLGHNVLIPALVGGTWARDLNVGKPESPYLAFIVGLHVATAIALLIYFWRDWVRIIGGFLGSLRTGRIQTTDQKLAWMIILATIPVGITGLLLEKAFREFFGVPVRAAVFLFVNGLILLAGERFRTRASLRADAETARGDAQAARGDAQAARGDAQAAQAAQRAQGGPRCNARRKPPRSRPWRPRQPRQPRQVAWAWPAVPRAAARTRSPPTTGPPGSRRSPAPLPPTGGWPGAATSRPSSSAPRRSSRCWPASAGTG